MRILSFAPYALYGPHFETDLELVENHLDEGDSCSLVVCRGELAACDINLHHRLAQCACCVGRHRVGIRALRAPVTTLPLLSPSARDRRELRQLPTGFKTTRELTDLRVDNFDLGYAVLSSIISALREPEPDLERHRGLVHRVLVSSLAVYRSAQRSLRRVSPDRVYLYNGRYSVERAVLRACQSVGAPCYIHERGSTLSRYSLFPNTLPHDLEYRGRLIEEAWEQSPLGAEEKRAVASRFYEGRARAEASSWYSFVAQQQAGLLPPGWDASRENIVIFSSSEDEFAAIGPEFANPLYASQLEGVQQIARDVVGEQRLQLYLRVHPNQRGVDNSQTRKIRELQAPSLTVIPPDSEVSSYALLRHASKVVTFGSTMGIEAVYWRVPSVLLGHSLYQHLGGTYQPRTHAQVLATLRGQLRPQEELPALKYGFYLQTFGTEFRHFKPTGIHTGEFKGRRLRPSRARALAGFCLQAPGLVAVDRVLSAGRRARSLLAMVRP